MITFLDLPAELRNEIYHLALFNDNDDYVELRCQRWMYDPRDTIITEDEGMFRYDSSVEPPDLLRVCKQIREEAAPIYYSSHEFTIDVEKLTDHEIENAVKWIYGVSEICGNKPFGSIIIDVVQPRLDDLENLYPLVQLLYNTDIELTGRPTADPKFWDKARRYESWTGLPVVHSDDTYGSERDYLSWQAENGELEFEFRPMPSQEFMKFGEDAVALAKKARKEGWVADALDVEFSRLILTLREAHYAKVSEKWLKKMSMERQRKQRHHTT